MTRPIGRASLGALLARAVLIAVLVFPVVFVVGGFAHYDDPGRFSWTRVLLIESGIVIALGAWVIGQRSRGRRFLARIHGTWTSVAGSSKGLVRHSVDLQTEDGAIRTYSATGALAVQEEGEIGVACVRGGQLVAFEKLDV